MNAEETHIGVRVSRAVAERIQRVAERTHRNKSQVLRMCVEEYIASAEASLGINSTGPSVAPSAASVTQAALKERQPKPPVDAPSGAVSKPATSGRKPRARQQ